MIDQTDTTRLAIDVHGEIFEAGQVFEAETKKGGRNYIIFMMCRNGWAYYCHADKGKKVQESQFRRLIEYGDLKPIHKDQVDVERLSLSVLGLMAMSQGLTFNDYMKVMHGYGGGSQAG